MLVDYHTHHYRCGHASGQLIDYVRQAAKLGFYHIGLSDHAPIYHLGPHPHVCPTTAMAQSEFPNYVAEALAIKAATRGKTHVRVGVESDYVPDWENHYRTLWDSYPLDYRIGSVHWLGNWSIFSTQLPHGRSAESIMEEYLETTQAMAKSGIYDIVGHLDCLKTMGVFTSQCVTKALVKTIEILGETGMVVELNTSGWRKRLGEAYPTDHLLRICREHGVGITLGSDAHRPLDVGYDFPQAVALLQKIGYRDIVSFTNRQKSTIPIDDISLPATLSKAVDA